MIKVSRAPWQLGGKGLRGQNPRSARRTRPMSLLRDSHRRHEWGPQEQPTSVTPGREGGGRGGVLSWGADSSILPVTAQWALVPLPLSAAFPAPWRRPGHGHLRGGRNAAGGAGAGGGGSCSHARGHSGRLNWNLNAGYCCPRNGQESALP